MKTNLALVLALFWAVSAAAATIPTVPIGNPGNPADVRYAPARGAVGYSYHLAKTEVTNAQYTEFLNAVAASERIPTGWIYNYMMEQDTRGGIVRNGSPTGDTDAVKAPALGGAYTYADKPVVFVSWYDAIRFANWMHNGQGSGDTENGAYTLLGGAFPTNANSITRNPGARWWLPNRNEWYKAAYHKNNGVTGDYWDYPTGTNSVPNNNLPSSDTGNSANFTGPSGRTTGSTRYPMTDVGAYTLTRSPYGTFDQGGNVYEWNETLTGSSRGTSGGDWVNGDNTMHARSNSLSSPASEGTQTGFRLASTPEPGTFVLLFIGSVATVLPRRRKTVG